VEQGTGRGYSIGEHRREEGAVEQGRERIENFLRRFGYEANRVVRVLAVAVAILLALLLALRALRILRVLTVPVVIGAILVVGWLLLGSLTIPTIRPVGTDAREA